MVAVNLLQPTHLLYESIHRPKVKGQTYSEFAKPCPLCGIPTQDIVPWKTPAKFSDLDIFAEKEGLSFLCPACAFALGHIKELHKPYLLTLKEGFQLLHFDDDERERQTPFGQVLKISRYFLMDFLLNAPTDDPWVFMLQSKINPQHSLIHAKVNYGESDTLYVSEGQTVHMIPKKGLHDLLMALKKIKCSESLYPCLFKDGPPRKDHPEIETWKEIVDVISMHRHKHYLPFLYDRIIPPKKYMLENTLEEEKEK